MHKNNITGDIPDALQRYQPNIEYLLLDVGRLELDKYQLERDNLVVSLIELERVSDITDSTKITDRLANLLKGKEFDSLGKAFTEHIKSSLKLHEEFPGERLTNLQEVNTVLQEKMNQWKNDLRKEGIETSRQTLLHNLVRLLNQRHYITSNSFKSHLSNATATELQALIEKVLDGEPVEVTSESTIINT